jgi:diadenylate cyclase
MVEVIRTFLIGIVNHLRLADVLDIAVASVFVYAFISWIRQTRPGTGARAALLIIVLLAVLFLAARRFEMFLVEILAEVLLVLVGLGAAVIFQSDLHRAVSRFATSLTRRHVPEEMAPSSTIDAITEAAAKMAEIRRGALIAVRGHES